MAAYPLNYTGRVWVDYETKDDGVEHTVQMRYAPDNPGGVLKVLADLASVLTSFGAGEFATGWKAVRARHTLPGENFAFPIALPPFFETFVGTGNTITPDREALEFRFVGRGATTGRKVSLSLYGMRGSIVVGNYRYVASASTSFQLKVKNAVDALNGADDGMCVLDGDKPVWYPYLNLNYNSYWERRIRAGA